LDPFSISYILLGSTIGLFLRIFIINAFKFKKNFCINNISLVNFLASFFLGILVVLNPINKNSLLFYVGFLGCFSTFSSFIYQLFVLYQKGQLMRLFLYYIEVLIISLSFFYLGYYLMQMFQK